MRVSIKAENRIWMLSKLAIITLLAGILFRYASDFFTLDANGNLMRIFKTGIIFVVLGILSFVKFDILEKYTNYLRVAACALTFLTTVLMADEIVNNEVASSTIDAVSTFSKIPVSNVVSFLTIGVLFLFFFVIFNRISSSMIITEILVVFLAFMIVAVSEFRGVPLLASDLMSAKVAANVAVNYKYTPTYFDYKCLLMIVLQAFIFTQIRGEKGIKNKRARAASLAVTVIVATLFTKGIVFSDYLANNGIEIEYWKPSNSYKTYGTIPTFLRSVTYTKVEKPEGYTTRKIDSITSRYESDLVTNEMLEELPNVIIVINEAFSNLGVLGEFGTNHDYIPNYHALKDDCIKGYYYASSMGGGTANTEFEVLSSGSLGFLNGAIAFEVYLRNNLPALPAMLNDLGYIGCTAFHPCNAENYNRIEAYPCLGFKDFISIEDIDYKYEKLHRWMSDRETYKYIINSYEKEERTKPFFVYDLTMQNHSPYNVGSRFKNAVRITDDNYDEEAEEYLNLVAVSDQAISELIDYFEDEQKPTVLLFLGDHQPVLTDSFLKSVTNGESDNWGEEEWLLRYKTPFFIWTNYDIEEKEVEITSANFLQSIMLKAVGMPQTAFQKYLADLQEKIVWINSIGYMGVDGKFYHTYDKESPYYSDIEEYRMIQYNYLFDFKHRVNEFFELRTEN